MYACLSSHPCSLLSVHILIAFLLPPSHALWMSFRIMYYLGRKILIMGCVCCCCWEWTELGLPGKRQVLLGTQSLRYLLNPISLTRFLSGCLQPFPLSLASHGNRIRQGLASAINNPNVWTPGPPLTGGQSSRAEEWEIDEAELLRS